MIDEQARIVGDRIATAGTFGAPTVWSLSELASVANDLVPLLTVLVLVLTAGWWVIRYVDRFRFGPKRGRDDG